MSYEARITTAIIGLILFIIFFLIEVFFGFIEDETKRKRFKIIPLLIASITIIIIAPNYPLIYMGAIFGLIGDALLIKEEKKIFFLLGTLSFFLGHICYLIAIILETNFNFVWWYIFIIIGSCFFVDLGLFPLLRKFSDKTTCICGGIYIFTLLMNLVTGITFSVLYSPFYILFSLGYALFMISDSMVMTKNFIKQFKRDDFYIMITYLLAQILLISGLLCPILIK
ncbi:MAG: lysoplasmalogenase [Bacilli bacterium]